MRGYFSIRYPASWIAKICFSTCGCASNSGTNSKQISVRERRGEAKVSLRVLKEEGGEEGKYVRMEGTPSTVTGSSSGE